MNVHSALIFIVMLVLGVAITTSLLRIRARRKSLPRVKGRPRSTSRGTALRIVTDAGPLAEIHPVKATCNYPRIQLAQDRQVMAGLQALLQRAPELLRDAAALGNQAYIVRFAPEIARGLADGSLTMMQAMGGGLRASAIDAAGRIVGNPVLLGPSAAVTGALAVWQVMALVTAQKFLADINERLVGIERAVTAVRDCLADEQHGKLDGSLRYLRSLTTSLTSCELTEADLRAFVDQLEGIGRSAQDIMAMQERQLARVAAEFDNLQLSGRGFDAKSTNASALITTFHHASEPWWVAAQVRGIVCQLRARLPVSRDVSVSRIRELKTEMCRQEAIGKRFAETVLRRVAELDSAFTRDKTAAKHQRRIRVEAAELEHRLGIPMKELTAAANDLERQIHEPSDEMTLPAELLVTVDGRGVPIRVERILANAP